MKRSANAPYYVPDYMAVSIEDIDFKRLSQEGVRFVAFDADSTLVPYRGIEISTSTREFLRKQRHLFKNWCIASNRITNDLQPLADSIDATVIRATLTVRKPQRRFFRWVLRHLGASPAEVVMIGDKLIADMYGGKRAGFKTVWVEHMGKDGPVDRISRIRQIEKWLLKRHKA